MAHLLAVISPGPDFVVALRNSLQYSRKTGVWTALGFALGILVHMIYCMAGVALLIKQSAWFFDAIKITGGIYLLYIGFQSFIAKNKKLDIFVEVQEDISWIQALKMGFVTNVLNPKATLFFLSLFTVLIKPTTPFWVSLVVALIMILNTFLWFTLVAFLFTQKRVQRAYIVKQGLIHKMLGAGLIVLGLFVIGS